jgi:segregation and condensation protein B
MSDNEEQFDIDIAAAMAQEFGGIDEKALTGVAITEEISSETSNSVEAFVPVEIALPTELEDAQVKSIIESLLFASVHPVSFAQIKGVFHGVDITSDRLHDIIGRMTTDCQGGERGVTLDEVSGGFQLRTKVENSGWLKRMVKARPFRLSGPALEVLSIVAYKQPLIKSEVDDIRGVESGHLVRALMEKNLVKFAGKSELPGKPMLYATTKQFLELFGLRNIRELPTLSEIDKLIPDGIGDESDFDKETLGSLADKIAIAPGKSYSEAETELLSITDAISEISTSSEFFEQEKIREREKRDNERAQDLRERQIVGETLPDTDLRWLLKFEAKLEEKIALANAPITAADLAPAPEGEVIEAVNEIVIKHKSKPKDKTESSEPVEADVASLSAAARAAFSENDL